MCVQFLGVVASFSYCKVLTSKISGTHAWVDIPWLRFHWTSNNWVKCVNTCSFNYWMKCVNAYISTTRTHPPPTPEKSQGCSDAWPRCMDLLKTISAARTPPPPRTPEKRLRAQWRLTCAPWFYTRPYQHWFSSKDPPGTPAKKSKAATKQNYSKSIN